MSLAWEKPPLKNKIIDSRIVRINPLDLGHLHTRLAPSVLAVHATNTPGSSLETIPLAGEIEYGLHQGRIIHPRGSRRAREPTGWIKPGDRIQFWDLWDAICTYAH